LELFSDSSVRSAQKCFARLPVSLTIQETISEEDIKKHMGNTFFCVPIDEFEKTHQVFLHFAHKGEQTLQKEKVRRKKHILLKIAVMLLCFGAVFAFSQFGFISESFTQIMYGVLVISSIVFMIWG